MLLPLQLTMILIVLSYDEIPPRCKIRRENFTLGNITEHIYVRYFLFSLNCRYTNSCMQSAIKPPSCSAVPFVIDQRHREMKTKEKSDRLRKTKLETGSK